MVSHLRGGFELDKKGTDMKKWLSLLVLCCGTGVIFQLPYIRNTFYIPLVEALNLTNEEFGALSTSYATISMICYFFGGWIADRVSPRKLLTISFISTGVVGLFFSTFPSYGAMRLIFAAFGVTTVLTYWSALIKAVRGLGDSSEQGRLFGILEGGRGVVSATAVFLLLALFNSLGGGKFGLSWVIRSYAFLAIVVGVALWFLIKEKKEETATGAGIFSQVKDVLLMPKMWLICLIIFTAYSIYAILSFLPPYMVSVYGMSKDFSVQIGGIRYIIQFAGGITGGFLADKIGSRIKTVLLGYMAIIAFLVVFLLIPQQTTLATLCVFDFVFLSVVVYAVRGIYFAVIDEAQIDRSVTGAVSGMASCVGYLPDVFLYTMIGRWIDNGISGYRSMFLYGIGTCVVGAMVAVILLGSIKRNKKREA